MEKSREQLEKEIQEHDRQYWVENKTVISDTEYDAKVRQLQRVAPDSPVLQQVHSPVRGMGKKIQHTIPMLSLAKVYELEELFKWCKKVARGPEELFLIEPKYDGCSAELMDGILSTRGDGKEGEDITHHLPIITIKQGEQNISPKSFKGMIRGEIVMLDSVFERERLNLVRKGGELFKNSRNAVGGILNREDNEDIKAPILTLIDFHQQFIKVSLKDIESLNWEAIITQVQDMDYPADGLVIKLADFDYGQTLGTTDHHRKCEMALKFANPTGETVLLGITWSQGKHNLTPIGNVIPVEISGVTVSNINLHNMRYLADNDIQIGDTLIVERCGDVIPDVQSVIPGKKREKPFINICPSCGSQVLFKDPEMVCTSTTCPGKMVNRLMDSIIRIGIERLGKPTLEKMVDTLGTQSLIDIFNMTKDDILRLPGFAETSAQNLFGEIQKVKEGGVFEWQILAAVNMSGIGRTLSKSLMASMSLDDLLNLVTQPNCYEKIQENEMVGPDRAAVIITGVRVHEDYIRQLMEILPIKREKEEAVPEDQITVCFTGKFPEKKAFYYALLSGSRYKVVEKVDKTLGALIVADPSKSSGKQKKAEKLNISVLSVDSLLEQVQQQGV